MAAPTLSGTSTINRETHKDLFDRTFDDIKEVKDNVPMQGGQFFSQEKAARLDHKKGSMSSTLDLPVISEDEDDLPFVQPVTGYNKTFTLSNYRSAIKITRKMVELDQWSLITRLMGGLFNSYQRKREFQYAAVFNGAFSDTGSDGVALFSASHPHVDSSHGNWDNLEAGGDLTADSYSTMRLAMRNRTGEKGFIEPRKLNQLIVVAEKERKAKEVLGSVQTAGTELNNKFAFFGESDVYVWDWLTSSTAWFGLDKNADTEDKGLFEFVQANLDIADITSTLPHDIIMGKRLRFTNVCGATLMKAYQGNAGA